MSNFLNLVCPECGAGSSLRISGLRLVDVLVAETGLATLDVGPFEYDAGSAVICGNCEWEGLFSQLAPIKTHKEERI